MRRCNGDSGESTAVGAFLREQRRKRRLTQQELADLSTISVRAIRDIEASRVDRPRDTTIDLLYAALRVPERDRVANTCSPPACPGQPRTPVPRLAALPNPVSGLIGREQELSLIAERVLSDGQRLITVTGLPGVGKTALAVEAARTICARMDAPVTWVSADESEWTSDEGRRLIESVRKEERLLVLDGLHPAVRHDWVTELLWCKPQMNVIATCATTLGLAGEWALTLGPLTLPGRRSESNVSTMLQVPSVHMLVTQIRQVLPALRLDQVGLVALADLCRLVDGVPLALERAGRAWLTESPVNCLALARRDPYSLLARGEPNGPKFHARMSAHLADLPCNALFQELAQLRDGWTIGEAAGVTRIPHGDLLSAVVIMLSRGMLLRNDSRVSTRFSMLNLVRSIIVSPST